MAPGGIFNVEKLRPICTHFPPPHILLKKARARSPCLENSSLKSSNVCQVQCTTPGGLLFIVRFGRFGRLLVITLCVLVCLGSTADADQASIV